MPRPSFRRLSLRARLLLLSLVLVTTGLAVSDTVVLGTVRHQLEQRMDEQLLRFAEPLSHRAATRQAAAAERSGDRSQPSALAGKRPLQYLTTLPSQYVVQYLSADGRVQQILRQPIADSDPAPQLGRL